MPGAQPVLLLLRVTLELFGAADATGRPRIADPDDSTSASWPRRSMPARRRSLRAGDFDEPPDAASSPAPVDRVGARTWRRLRAHDWRLVDDLRPPDAHGTTSRQPWRRSAAAAPSPDNRHR